MLHKFRAGVEVRLRCSSHRISYPSVRLKKFLLSVVIAAVLGLQLWIILPPGRHGVWYWPFMEYPMYSGAHTAGESVMMRDIRISGCGPQAHRSIVTDTLNIPFVRYSALLNSVVSKNERTPERDSLAALLGHAIETRYGAHWCEAQILARPIPVANFDWTVPATPMVPVYEWTLHRAPAR